MPNSREGSFSGATLIPYYFYLHELSGDSPLVAPPTIVMIASATGLEPNDPDYSITIGYRDKGGKTETGSDSSGNIGVTLTLTLVGENTYEGSGVPAFILPSGYWNSELEVGLMLNGSLIIDEIDVFIQYNGKIIPDDFSGHLDDAPSNVLISIDYDEVEEEWDTEISWQYEEEEPEGFGIFKNDVVIGVVPGNVNTYTDNENPLPGDVYTVIAFDGDDISNPTPASLKELTLTKTPSPETFDDEGQTITYRYIITNNTGETLEGPFFILDDTLIVVVPSVNELLPSASIIVDVEYETTSGDVVAEIIENNAFAFGLDSISSSVNAVVTYDAHPEPPIVPDIEITGSGGFDFGGSATIVYMCNPSGIYTLVVGKTHDTLYERMNDIVTVEAKIPNPFAITGFIDADA